MAQPAEPNDTEPVVTGADGFVALGLSAALMLLSLGASAAVAFCYVLCIAVGSSHAAPPTGRIIVLGMRLGAAGEPTTDYEARLDRARTLWLSAPDSDIIILGGSTSRGQRSKAAAGAARLRALSLPADRVQTEERSRHTLENLRIYRARFTVLPDEKPLLVTCRFHLARSSLLATGLAIAHTRCAAEEGRFPTIRDLPRMLREALLIHWYVTGRCFASLTGNTAMAARITWSGRRELLPGFARPGDRQSTADDRLS